MTSLDTYFTPVLDPIVAELSRDHALTWGIVWRLSQKHGYTTARHSYMADIIGQAHRTFTRRLKDLVKAGMIQDMDPDLKGGIHRYRTLRYTIMPVAVSLDTPVDPEADPEGLGQEDPGHSDLGQEDLGQSDLTLGQSDLTPGQSDLTTPVTVTYHEDISHDTSHDTSHDMPAEKPPQVPEGPPPRPDQVFFGTLAAVCELDPATITDEQRGQINQASGILRNKAGAKVGDLVRFRDWWNEFDWRGKRKEAPTPSQVRETWGKYTHWLKAQEIAAETQAVRAAAQAAANKAAKEAREKQEAADPDMVKALNVWAAADPYLRGSMTQQTYITWIAPLVVLRPNGSFRLGAESEAVIEWVSNRLDGTVKNALKSVVGREVKVEYVLLDQ